MCAPCLQADRRANMAVLFWGILRSSADAFVLEPGKFEVRQDRISAFVGRNELLVDFPNQTCGIKADYVRDSN